MSKQITRRDFLKLAGVAPLSLTAPRFIQQTNPNQKNVVIVVFDALSAYNISLYGYSRDTMPNLAKLAERAAVYHQHYAGGNYTTTGTASLLTGLNAWTHRAFELNSEISDSAKKLNIFNAFQNYYKIAYTHNSLANTLLRQFQNDIDEWIPRTQLLLGSYGSLLQALLSNDEDLVSVAWTRAANLKENGYAYSLFLSHLNEPLRKQKYAKANLNFPLGVPMANQDDGFVLGQAIDYVSDRLAGISQPFLGYFHFLPPHAPYRTSLDFYTHFANDGFTPPAKPISPFEGKQDKYDMQRKRTAYDEFILYVDREFGRFYNHLEKSGLLENTVIVFTSDHGELFERGIAGHTTNGLYQPVVRIPLLIFDPDRQTRADIHTPTSAIDILPTLARLTGQAIPPWSEGKILPPFESADPNRAIYTLVALENMQDAPLLDNVSITITKGDYKLHYYAGYPKQLKNQKLMHLFNVKDDPEEMVDVVETKKEIANELINELKTKLAEVNQPYL